MTFLDPDSASAVRADERSNRGRVWTLVRVSDESEGITLGVTPQTRDRLAHSRRGRAATRDLAPRATIMDAMIDGDALAQSVPAIVVLSHCVQDCSGRVALPLCHLAPCGITVTVMTMLSPHSGIPKSQKS